MSRGHVGCTPSRRALMRLIWRMPSCAMGPTRHKLPELLSHTGLRVRIRKLDSRTGICGLKEHYSEAEI